jgi:hypothetical protein
MSLYLLLILICSVFYDTASAAAPLQRSAALLAEAGGGAPPRAPALSVEQDGTRSAVLHLPAPPTALLPSAGSARQLAACNLKTLVQPAAVPALASLTSALFGVPCSGLSGYTFSALMRNPTGADVAIYLGVGQAQCSAG